MAPSPRMPRNPDYERVVRESFGRQSLMATLGVHVAHLGPGEVHERTPIAAMLSTIIVRAQARSGGA